MVDLDLYTCMLVDLSCICACCKLVSTFNVCHGAVSSALPYPSEDEIVNINKTAQGNKGLTSFIKRKEISLTAGYNISAMTDEICYLLPELNAYK